MYSTPSIQMMFYVRSLAYRQHSKLLVHRDVGSKELDGV